MKANTYKELAQQAEISAQYLSQILLGKRRPSWRAAKRLAAASGLTPQDWLEKPGDEIRAELVRRIEPAEPVCSCGLGLSKK